MWHVREMARRPRVIALGQAMSSLISVDQSHLDLAELPLLND